MNIIGISGIEGAVPFKRKHWPGLDERDYRISQGHDAAAALVMDGRIIAAVAEERLNRSKHSAAFPRRAIASCLTVAGLELRDIDEIAHGFDYEPYRAAYMLDPLSRDLYDNVYSRDALLKLVARDLPGFPPERVRQVEHHIAHAASAALTSGWNECVVVVLDGMGEAHSVTAYHARDGRMSRLGQVGAGNSIGVLYSLITLHLGFDFNADEYKIMGLAPYGDATRYRSVFDRLVTLTPDGGVHIPALRRNRTRDERELYLGTRAYLAEHLGAPRDPAGEITQDHRDVAAALQACLDRAMTHICGSFTRGTGLRRLALAGGVALNCTANGQLLQSGVCDELYIQPAAGDDGTALGAALFRASLAGEVVNERMRVPFVGPPHAEGEIAAALEAFHGRVTGAEFSTLEATCEAAAERIAAGRVVAWWRGRMEFGPRALGHRSILADPGGPDMRERINGMVKMREAFRPFAPAVSLEQVDRWFDVPAGTRLPYMIVTVDVRPEFRAALPAVTHVNGSARVQTVSNEDNAAFHALLRAVGKRTGREMVLNTSFNVKGQPIVNTPREAIETFLSTGIDDLFLEDTLVTRPD